MITRILSGGQTGADRAGLDVAIELGIPHGGWCPRGRRAEDGPIPARYILMETRSAEYPERTRLNVRDSDGVVVFSRGRLGRGSALTLRVARELAKPHLYIDLVSVPAPAAAERLSSWLEDRRIEVLDVAGNRESGSPGIYKAVRDVLRRALQYSSAAPGSRTIPPLAARNSRARRPRRSNSTE
jgi:hypothetical protein